ncbi:hypothetical protein [Natronobacterium gregoryi]|uniref:Uncharacterized protein n=2 Tax=Natronobacterium gregoryi TaxID=44930 RepID=L0AFE1_NATGS|nr:hypothetical protein [Natronobacterium gregoryi]AFZ72144.1 hypothetical protein Natgr_0907 [Natronobacterium gregoryi SP2]ELY62826.1 hypothetical protein C490_16723 [Natronobacterium gregoryi SP2]PLK19282.1 hypothetical protein CYV19_15630 [Natronobacterium gregoryi SP2]SFJ54302.1 hypothetical protein SAMN05443661_1381 [Natronobacterium gregoryi]
MGILDLMLGQADHGEQGVEGHSYKLPKETHDFVYPVAVRRRELEAFDRLIQVEADAPYLEENVDELQAVFDDVLESHEIDAAKLIERKRATRRAASSIVEGWLESVEDDVDVVYVSPGTDETLREFVKLCKQRNDESDDPFDVPEQMPDAVALLKRVDEATDDQYRAVVHIDLLPGN